MKGIPPRRTAALLLALTLPLLPACQPGMSPPPPAVPDTATTEADTSAEVLRAYYEQRIAELREALLNEKQADYVSRLEYEARIAELEAKLSAAEPPPSAGEDIPVAVPPAVTVGESSTEAPATLAFHYEFDQNTAVILAYTGTAEVVAIPETIGGLPVTRIADNAFQSAPVVAVAIPPTVTEIGWFAFAECSRLLTVNIPASVVTIHYGAFDGSNALTIRCPKGSYAAEFAASFGLRVAYDADEAN